MRAGFGELLRLYRQVAGLTQEELADRAQLSARGVQDLERGARQHPRPETVRRLSAALSLDATRQAGLLQAAAGREVRAMARLPVPGALVDRRAELDRLQQLLNDPDRRLVTLTGPGGIGKTRLALATAELAKHAGDLPVYFVPLGSLSAVEHLPTAIGGALGCAFYGPADLGGQLADQLRDSQLLLILDAFEHLVSGAALVADIVVQAPGVKVLVTSRERLNLRHEWVVEVPGLAVPSRAEEGMQNEPGAVDLFIATAQRVGGEGGSLESEMPSIVRICRTVEGLPLAVELAAGLVRFLSCSDIAEEIQRSLRVLTTEQRDVPERHRSMQVVFDHSWSLLTDDERSLLRRLSVFKEGFTRAAAEAVAGAQLATLASLQDKSLLRRSGDRRYQLHDLLRHYASEQLGQMAEGEAATRERHSDYYMRWLGDHRGDLRGERQRTLIEAIHPDFDNIRAAWDWAVEHRRVDRLQGALQTLLDFYDINGWFVEGAEAFGRAAESIRESTTTSGGQDEAPALLLGELLAGQGWLSLALGQPMHLREILLESLALLQRDPPRWTPMHPLTTLGTAAFLVGEYDAADNLLGQSLQLQIGAADVWGEGWSLGILGLVAAARGNYGHARELIERARESYVRLGDQRTISLALSLLSLIASAEGRVHDAYQLAEQGHLLSLAAGHVWGRAVALCQWGTAALLGGDLPVAQRLFEQAVERSRVGGEAWATARSLIGLGHTRLALHQPHVAKEQFLEALKMARQAGLTPSVIDALMGLATILAQQGNVGLARQGLQVVAGHPATTAATKLVADSLKSSLDDGAALEPDLVGPTSKVASIDEVLDLVVAHFESVTGPVAR